MRSASKTLSEPQDYGTSHTPGIPMELTDKISAMAERKTPDQSFEHRQNDTCAESNLLNGNPKAEGCNRSSNERQSKRLHQLKKMKSCFFCRPKPAETASANPTRLFRVHTAHAILRIPPNANPNKNRPIRIIRHDDIL